MLNGNITVPDSTTAESRLARTGRALRRRWLYLSVAAATAIAGITAVQAATAQAAPSACLSGYLCLVLSPSGTGNVALVTAGQVQQFPSSGLPVTQLVNNTTDLYCLEEINNGFTFFTSIAAGTTKNVTTSIVEVNPGSTCPV